MKTWEGQVDLKESSEIWGHTWNTSDLGKYFPSSCKPYALAWIIINCIAKVLVGIKRDSYQKEFSKRIQVLHIC